MMQSDILRDIFTNLMLLEESIDTNLATLYQDMPECAEKTLLLLKYYFSQSRSSNKTKYLISSQQEIIAIGALRIQLQNESLLNSTIKEKISQIEQLILQQVSSVERQTRKLISEISRDMRPLNVDLLLQLLQGNREARDEITGQDIVLLLGESGAGKSLTVHFLAGSEIQRDEQVGLKVVGMNPLLESFKTTHSTHSITRCINSICIASGAEETMIVCDTPGFNDTGGAEYDIANGFCIAEAMRRCRSIKPVIFLSQKGMGDRCQGISSMSNLLVKIFSSIEQHAQTFTFVFTKFQKEQEHEIRGILESVLNDVLESDQNPDDPYVALLNTMVNDTDRNGVFILDPVNDTPERLLNVVKSKKAIFDPQDNVQKFVTPKSMETLSLQLEKDRASIKSAFECLDVGILNYKLKQLQKLNELMSTPKTKQFFQEAVKEVEQLFEKNMTLLSMTCRKIVDTPTIYNTDAEALRDLAIKVLTLEHIRSSCGLDDSGLESNSMSSIVIWEVKTMCASLKKKVEHSFNLEMFQHPSSLELPVMAFIAVTLNKMSSLFSTFSGYEQQSLNFLSKSYALLISELKESYHKIGSILELSLKFENAKASAFCLKIKTSCIELLDLELFVVRINFIDQAKNALSEHQAIINIDLAQCYSDITAGVLGSCTEIAQDARNLFSRIQGSGPCSFQQEIDQALFMMEQVSKIADHNFGVHFSSEPIQAYHTELSSAASSLLHSLFEELELHVKGQQPRLIDFSRVQILLSMTLAFFKNRNLQIAFSESYFNIVNSINMALQSDAEYLLHQLPSHQKLEASSISSCRMSWQNLQSAAQLSQPFERLASKLNAQVTERALFLLDNFELSALVVQTKPSKLEVIVLELEWITLFCSSLGIPVEKVQSAFFERVMHELAIVFELFSSKITESTDYSHLCDALTFYECIKRLTISCTTSPFESVTTSPLKLGVPNQLIGLIENLDRASITVQQQFNNVFSVSSEKFQKISELGKVEVDTRALIFGMVKSLETLKHIQQLHSNKCSEVFVGSDSEVLTFIFYTKPNEIISYWCASSGVLASHLKQLFSSSDTACADVLCLLCDNSKLCIDFDHLFHSEPIDHHFGRISNFKDLVQYLNYKLDKYVGGMMTSLKCFIACNNYGDFHKVLSGIESSLLDDNTEYTDVLTCLRKEIVSQLDKADKILTAMFLSLRVQEDYARGIVDTICDLQKADTFALQYFSQQVHDEMKSKIFNIQVRFKEIMSRYVQTVDDLVENNKFSLAATIIKSCKAVAELARDMYLPVHDEPENSEKEIINVRDMMLSSLKIKEQGLKSSLTLAIDNYRSLEVQKYRKSPPSGIFEELRQAESIDPQYGYLYKLLAEIICFQVTELLQEDSCKQCQCKISLDKLQERFLLIESLSAYLPSDVVKTYTQNLKFRKNSLQKTFESTSLDAKDLRDARNLDKMVQKYRSYLRDGECTQANIFNNFIKSQLCEDSFVFEDDLQKGDFVMLLSGHFPALWAHWWEFCNMNQEAQIDVGCEACSLLDKSIQTSVMENDSLNLCSKLVRLTSDKLTAAINALLKLSPLESNKESIRIICHELPKVLYFVTSVSQAKLFFCEVAKQVSDYANQIHICLGSSAEYLLSRQQMFERAVQSANFILLADMLSDTQQLELLYGIVEGYAKTELFQELPLEFRSAFVGQKLLHYAVIQQTVEDKMQKWFSFLTKQFESDSRALHVNEFQRREFFKELSDTFLILMKASKVPALLQHVHATKEFLVTAEETCRKHFGEQLSMIEGRLLQLVNNLDNAVANYTEFNTLLSSLDSMLETFEDSSVRSATKLKKEYIQSCFSTLLNVFEKETLELLNRLVAENKTSNSKSSTLQAFIEQLITLKEMSIHISFYKQALNDLIDQLMSCVEKKPRSIYLIASISLSLQNDLRPTAKALITETKVFAGYALEFRNRKTQNCTIEDVLSETKGSDVCSPKLRELYEAFETVYWQYVDTYMVAREKQVTIIAHILSDARESSAKLKPKTTSKHPKYDEVCTKLIACLFAYWTLAHFQKMSILPDTDKNKLKSLLLKPHATQVVAIFRMLGMDNPNPLSGHLVQMLTGEGKSVVLGVSSAVLALMGYEVYCACYSEYLSKRDYLAFETIFQVFRIEHLVTYGTVPDLARDYIHQVGDICTLVEEAITGSSPTTYTRSLAVSPRPKILLLDEVDVFFSKDFYGRAFRPAFCLRDPVITTFIQFIWDQRENTKMLSVSSIKKTEVYDACLAKFSVLEEYLERSMEEMLWSMIAVVHGLHCPYEVECDKIGYRHHDGLSFTQSVGYETMFAYFKEHSEGRISQASLNRNISLEICCGEFSYAEIPKEYFCVIGVTGTLQTFMAHPAVQMIQETYKISQTTYIPSAFGNKYLTFSACIACSDDSFNRVLRDEIRYSLGQANTYQRAVLVFFEDADKLKASLSSEFMKELGEIRTMTEVDSLVTREGAIGQATLSGNVTFLVRAFGRGTDFICYDDDLISAGGIHVIQTFVSIEKTEEEQIKGRTARQGDKGSFSMILCENELVNKFGLSSEIFPSKLSTQELYIEIDKNRCELFIKKWSDPEKKAAYESNHQQLQIKHEQSMIFLRNLVNERIVDMCFLVSFLTECTFGGKRPGELFL